MSYYLPFVIFTLLKIPLYVTFDYCTIHPKHILCFSWDIGTITNHERCKGKVDATPKEPDIQQLLNYINGLRSDIATGKQESFFDSSIILPEAADMVEIEWDEELAQVAQRRAATCGNVDLLPAQMIIANFQTKEIYTHHNFSTIEINFLSFLRGEGKKFNPNLIDKYNKSESYDIFTTLAYSKSRFVGCGRITPSYFQTRSVKYFGLSQVCIFAPSEEDFNNRLYKKGLPCSKCGRKYVCSNTFAGLCKGPAGGIWAHHAALQGENEEAMNSTPTESLTGEEMTLDESITSLSSVLQSKLTTVVVTNQEHGTSIEPMTTSSLDQTNEKAPSEQNQLESPTEEVNELDIMDSSEKNQSELTVSESEEIGNELLIEPNINEVSEQSAESSMVKMTFPGENSEAESHSKIHTDYSNDSPVKITSDSTGNSIESNTAESLYAEETIVNGVLAIGNYADYVEDDPVEGYKPPPVAENLPASVTFQLEGDVSIEKESFIEEKISVEKFPPEFAQSEISISKPNDVVRSSEDSLAGPNLMATTKPEAISMFSEEYYYEDQSLPVKEQSNSEPNNQKKISGTVEEYNFDRNFYGSKNRPVINEYTYGTNNVSNFVEISQNDTYELDELKRQLQEFLIKHKDVDHYLGSKMPIQNREQLITYNVINVTVTSIIVNVHEYERVELRSGGKKINFDNIDKKIFMPIVMALMHLVYFRNMQ